MAYKGYFKPKNPQKYKGNPTNIIYRSRWELTVMSRFDNDPNVIWWASEEMSIPYRSPVDGRIHRYYPDFIVKLKDAAGKEKKVIIEVKPFYQTQAPERHNSKGGKPSRRYINEVMTYGVNEAKWKAAQEYALDQGYEFKILTEKELGLTF